MENAGKFREKMRSGQVALGTVVTFSDPTITEALCSVCDFVWIDMEHNPQSLETVQGHIMATKASDTAPLVRVPWNDPVLIKPVLDIGAAGVIIPLIQTAEEAQRAVAACLYPPHGIRGYGPRRAAQFGRLGGPEFCKAANETVIPIVQIEHIRAVENLDAILAVPGLVSILIGPNDLAGSMGRMGQPRHPDVLQVIDSIIEKARKTSVFVGLAVGDDPKLLIEWTDRGIHWLAMGADFSLLLRSANQVAGEVRDHCRRKSART